MLAFAVSLPLNGTFILSTFILSTIKIHCEYVNVAFPCIPHSVVSKLLPSDESLAPNLQLSESEASNSLYNNPSISTSITEPPVS